jgi:hypothetical protein
VTNSKIHRNSSSPVPLYHHLLVYYLNQKSNQVQAREAINHTPTFSFASQKPFSLSFSVPDKQWRRKMIKHKNSFSGPNSLISTSQTTSLYTLIALKTFPDSKTVPV